MSQILIYGKHSKLAIDMERWHLDEYEMREHYAREKLAAWKIERIFESHRQQDASLRLLRELLGHHVPLMMWHPKVIDDDISYAEWAGLEHAAHHADILISLGGDNNFQFASKYREDGLILGLNSDPGPGGSKGKLLWGSVPQFAEVVDRFKRGDFTVQPWMRLDLELDGKYIGRASNQISLSAAHPMLMSRHVLTAPNGTSVEQKGSGLLIATGAGSTGWYRSERGSSKHDFPRDAAEARWFLRAAQLEDDDTTCELSEGAIRNGEVLRVQSLNDRGGIAGVDDTPYAAEPGDFESSSFNRGVEATIRLSEHPLRVITF